MLGLVAGVVLVLATRHVQEAIHDRHTLVEAFGRQLRKVTPGRASLAGLPPEHLDNGRGQRSRLDFTLMGNRMIDD